MPYGCRNGDGAGAGDARSPPPACYDDAALWRCVTSCISEDVLRRVAGRAAGREWLVDTAAGDTPDFFPQPAGASLLPAAELTFLFPRDAVDLHLFSQADAAKHPARRRRRPPPPSTPPPTVLAVLSFSARRRHRGRPSGRAAVRLPDRRPPQQPQLPRPLVAPAARRVPARPRPRRQPPRPVPLLIQTLHAQLVYSDRHLAAPPETATGSGGSGGILDTPAPASALGCATPSPLTSAA